MTLALAAGLLAPLAAAPAPAGAAAGDDPPREASSLVPDWVIPAGTDPAESGTPALLTLDARVVTDDGGAAVPADWTLRADGPVVVDSAAGGALVEVPVPPGAYLLSAAGPTGFQDLGWQCSDGTLSGATIALEAGDRATCTVVHDDLPVDLVLDLDDGGARAANGGTFPLSIAVRNLGARDVDAGEPVAVTVAPPAGASIVEAPAGCTATDRLITCGIDPAQLPAGGAAGLAVTARFDDTARPGDYGTIASVSTQDDPAPADPGCAGESNGVDCESTELRFPTITLLHALSTDDGGDATSGDFALTASGPATVTGAPGSRAVTVASVPAGSYRLAAAAPAGYGRGAWTCAGGALDGSTVTIAGVVDVACTIAHDDLPVDLRLIADGGAAVSAGGEARVSLAVTNIGGRGVDPDEPVIVTDVLPAGLTYLDGPAGCSATGGTVSCALDPAALPAGGSVTIEIRVVVAADAPAGGYESRARVTTEDDPVEAGGCEPASNNVACTVTRVVAGVVTAEKAVWEQVNGGWMSSDGAVGFGDLVQFRIVVRAAGDAPSTGVAIVDRLPGGLLLDGMASCSVPCRVALDAATGTQRVDIGTMAPGATVTVTITARVPGVPSQAEGTVVRVAFDSAAAVSSDNLASSPTNVATVRASHALPQQGRTGGDIPIGGISVALALLVAGGLLLVRSRELPPR